MLGAPGARTSTLNSSRASPTRRSDSSLPAYSFSSGARSDGSSRSKVASSFGDRLRG